MLERLGEEGRTGGETSGLHFGIFGVAGDEERAGAGADLCDLRLESAASHAGHHHVADEQVNGRRIGPEKGERGFAGVGFADFEAVAFEDFADEGANAFLVVDDQDALGRAGGGGFANEVELEAGAFCGG